MTIDGRQSTPGGTGLLARPCSRRWARAAHGCRRCEPAAGGHGGCAGVANSPWGTATTPSSQRGKPSGDVLTVIAKRSDGPAMQAAREDAPRPHPKHPHEPRERWGDGGSSRQPGANPPNPFHALAAKLRRFPQPQGVGRVRCPGPTDHDPLTRQLAVCDGFHVSQSSLGNRLPARQTRPRRVVPEWHIERPRPRVDLESPSGACRRSFLHASVAHRVWAPTPAVARGRPRWTAPAAPSVVAPWWQLRPSRRRSAG